MLRPGWRLLSGFADEREALFLYELDLSAGGVLSVANQMLFTGGRIAAEYVVFDSGRLAPGRTAADRACV